MRERRRLGGCGLVRCSSSRGGGGEPDAVRRLARMRRRRDDTKALSSLSISDSLLTLARRRRDDPVDRLRRGTAVEGGVTATCPTTATASDSVSASLEPALSNACRPSQARLRCAGAGADEPPPSAAAAPLQAPTWHPQGHTPPT